MILNSLPKYDCPTFTCFGVGKTNQYTELFYVCELTPNRAIKYLRNRKIMCMMTTGVKHIVLDNGSTYFVNPQDN